ncbi:MAG: prepilin-type N-terminal cleavage/methylation domain-containing protein [Candidatus Omnitrophica bacterium]|nr:prepilin-type N-terminal cleavage/methylation domain-containing protein [Candidatus Omnitrophota bacterium]
MRLKKGVTLIELLVAMGILALLVTILYSVFSVSLRAWKKADNIFKATTIARVVLDRISREISSALIKDNNFYCLGFDSTAPSGWRTNSIGDEFYFIAPTNPGKETSDLAELGYWLDGEGTAAANDDVLRRFYVLDDRNDVSSSDFDFNFSTGSANASDPFSENITDLQFTFFDTSNNPANSWDSHTDGVPSKIEILITVRIGQGTQATNPEFYQNSYTTTISFLK